MACACRCGRSTSSNSLSVYTPVSAAELDEWLRHYSVGRLQGLEPIKAGIENSNFFVTTTQGRYVLTLFERLPAAELPFYLELMAHLARHGIPRPAASPGSSISTSPASTACCTTSRCAPTTGASMPTCGSSPPAPARCSRRMRRCGP